ncbi:MAG: 50S ribosomal protein L13 [Proteobacteria bacterium]|nr:50S ribosomal protein L13 [Pseudomonadota bacterium]
MKMTASAKPTEVTRDWFVVDATDLPLGRLATQIAMRLRGKHKPSFTPHVDTGDNIIVINAEKVRLTGRKMEQEKHFWHTGHPGGIKEVAVRDELQGKYPERVIERAVLRMMPKESPLARDMMGKLHVYAGSEHPHAAQKPAALDVAALIRKKS